MAQHDARSGRGVNQGDERVRDAAFVVIIAVVFEGGGVLLLALDRALAIVAWPLIVFGIIGLFQAVPIAFGRINPRGYQPPRSERDDGQA